MSDIIIAKPREESLIDAAVRGLHGEISDLSRLMYDTAIKDFLSYVEEHKHEFGSSLAVAFSSYLHHLRDRGYTPSTLRAKRTQLRRFFEWGMRVGWISVATYTDALQVKAPKAQGKKAGRWITMKQMQELLSAPDVSTCVGLRDRAVLAIFMGTGLRCFEVANLTWGHLTRYGEAWVIRDLNRKHHRVQDYVPVPDFVVKAIETYSPRGKDDERIIVSYDRWGNRRGGITCRSLCNIVHEYTEKLGFKVAPHDLRRSYARAAKKEGMELSQLSLVLGHGSVEVTERYVNEQMEVEKLASVINLEI